MFWFDKWQEKDESLDLRRSQDVEHTFKEKAEDTNSALHIQCVRYVQPEPDSGIQGKT